MGDLAKAEAAYHAAIEIARGPAAAKVEAADKERWALQEQQAATRLADLQAQLGRADDAIATLRALVQSQPANAAAQSGLAEALVRAGKHGEAAPIYEKLLARYDLSDIELFNAGVGLYSAGNHALAVVAFQKSLQVNPHSRDAMYNLGQALYGQATEIEKQRAAAPDAEKAAFAAKLTPIYEEMQKVATRLQEVDPRQRNALMMQAQAQRSLGELAGDAAVKKEWQQKVLATLEAAEQMPFEVGPVDIRFDETGVTISGMVTNLNATTGQSIVLEFTLVGEGGAVVGAKTVTVTAPAPTERTRFEFELVTDKTVLGWRYAVAG